ncbi:MAG: GNAT family N-acetyltransferase [Kofleriaceae bacterium]
MTVDVRAEALVRPRHAYVKLPDMRVIERPGWSQIITPSFARGGFNEVSHSELSADEADRVIAETIEMYRGIGFRWTVCPDCRPLDLGARLERAGLTPSTCFAMARSTDMPGEAPDVIPVGAHNLHAFTRVTSEVWGADPVVLGGAQQLMLASGNHPMWLAMHEGEAVGAGSYVAFSRSAFLMNAVVVPAFRGRGAYRQLVVARLADARARGIPIATTNAMASTSAPMLRKMGFADVAELTMYRS